MTTAARIPLALTGVAPAPTAERRRRAWLLAGLVLLLHVALLSVVPRAPGPGWRAQPARWVQVRQTFTSPLLNPAATAVPLAAPLPSEPPPQAAASALRTRDAAPAPTAIAAPAMPRTERPTEAMAESRTESMTESIPESMTEPTPDTGGQVVPVYATVLPPPLTLQFEMRRGMAVGQAELDWRPVSGRYRLTLQGNAVGAPPIGWSSLGGFDPNGIAPLRYTESRRGREVRAANFQRDSGRITFSGPAIEHPLVAGAQDRLSWMVQLAAVLSANPALAESGSQVSMWVAGSRGDAEVWTFTVHGRVALDLPIGHVDNAVHLVREPRRPYDTQVQVWLDPARHHLPAQALLRVRATGEGTELRLRELVLP